MIAPRTARTRSIRTARNPPKHHTAVVESSPGRDKPPSHRSCKGGNSHTCLVSTTRNNVAGMQDEQICQASPQFEREVILCKSPRLRFRRRRRTSTQRLQSAATRPPSLIISRQNVHKINPITPWWTSNSLHSGAIYSLMATCF